MDESKILSLLGMARKANKLACGHDGVVGAIRSKKAKLCLLSSDASERLRNETEREIGFIKQNIPIEKLKSDMYEIGRATGLKSAVLAVIDEGFANALQKLLTAEQEGNE